MYKNNQNRQQNNNQGNRAATRNAAPERERLDVLSLIPYKDADGNDATRWIRSGAAFENKDGSISLLIDVMPIVPGSKMQIRKRDDENDNGNG